ncbi:MAG: hypothetical protein QNL68_15905 [Akkermansiaceae bacterium]
MVYNRDTSIAPQGYEVKSITTFMGWATQSPVQANQSYTVEVSVIGSAEPGECSVYSGGGEFHALARLRGSAGSCSQR